ncbi:hypothetical protein JOB18_013645 [Solea senegalensis]|uniref:Uncharacterized protein n=1 Tax=Solea senegalensis TaxID=28829 RepID=A0AAV6RAL7_SOLSE|nr:hypothetical protein JOB18_013645 [Solea senegalensis]
MENGVTAGCSRDTEAFWGVAVVQPCECVRQQPRSVIGCFLVMKSSRRSFRRLTSEEDTARTERTRTDTRRHTEGGTVRPRRDTHRVD